MRSRKSCSITSREVHQWSLNWLLQAKLLKDHGWRCTAAVVLNIVLRAAAGPTHQISRFSGRQAGSSVRGRI